MPSGAVPLLEAANCSGNMLKSGVVETLIQESPLMRYLPWLTFQGEALVSREEVDLPTPAYRNIGETYSRSYGTDTKYFWGTTILGGEIFVDNYEVRVMGDVVNIKAKQYEKMAKAMSRTFDKSFFDGTGTAKDFKGVNGLIDEGFGQVLYGGTNGGALTLELLDEAKDLMRGVFAADGIFCNRTMRRKITSLGRNIANGFSMIDVGDDAFGHQVTMYDGTPIQIIGDDINGDPILDFDETRGSSNVTTSLYFLGCDEDGVAGLLGLGGTFEVVDFGETQAAPGHLGRVEAYPGIAIFDKYAAVRIAGITNA